MSAIAFRAAACAERSAPSTALRAVPLPRVRRGRIGCRVNRSIDVYRCDRRAIVLPCEAGEGDRAEREGGDGAFQGKRRSLYAPPQSAANSAPTLLIIRATALARERTRRKPRLVGGGPTEQPPATAVADEVAHERAVLAFERADAAIAGQQARFAVRPRPRAARSRNSSIPRRCRKDRRRRSVLRPKWPNGCGAFGWRASAESASNLASQRRAKSSPSRRAAARRGNARPRRRPIPRRSAGASPRRSRPHTIRRRRSLRASSRRRPAGRPPPDRRP